MTPSEIEPATFGL